MKKIAWLVIILAVIIIILIGILILMPAKSTKNNQTLKTEGIQIISPEVNEEIFSPLKITGSVNGNGWGGFEGQVGTVKLLDDKGNQLGLAILTAIDDWMQPVVNFEAILNFQSPIEQSGTLVFHNENPSDMRDKDKTFILPVKIGKSSAGTISVKAYFNNNKMDPEISCNKVFAVEREIPKTEAIAQAALNELLKGPTDVEKNAGFSTSIPAGSKLNSISIINGEAHADFNEMTESGGGSCSMSARVSEITKTLMQFPTITSVKLSINGRTGDIFQP